MIRVSQATLHSLGEKVMERIDYDEISMRIQENLDLDFLVDDIMENLDLDDIANDLMESVKEYISYNISYSMDDIQRMVINGFMENIGFLIEGYDVI